MTLFPQSRSYRFLLVTALFLPAALFIVVFLASSNDEAAVAAKVETIPLVLGQNDPPAVESQVTVTVINPPELIKPLDVETVQAKSFLVYDAGSQAVLARRNEDFPLPIASLTKLLTAYIAHQNLDLATEIISVTAPKNTDVSPALGLRAGDNVMALDLFNSMLIGSANDAAAAFGDHLSQKTGLPIKDLMNGAAKKLGMTESRFSNPMGFDSETNYSTAVDLRLLVNATKQYPEFSTLGRKTSYSFKSELGYSYSVRTTNKLISADPEISAIKTGFTDEAQGAMITEINHQEHQFVIIVLGSPNREQDTLALKRAIINSYQWPD